MTRTLPLMLLTASLLTGGCDARPEAPGLEQAFGVARRGADPVPGRLGDESGDALEGNVQRLGPPSPPPTAATRRRIPIKLTQNQVGIFIRRQLARLTECQRAARGKAGKALLTVRIESTGRVSRVSVSAPDFRGTRLAACLKKGARRWRFPRFKKGPLTYTYPFLFR